MNMLKQLIAEARYGESESDRASAYRDALAMVEAKESLIAQPTLTTAEFKRISNGFGLEVVKLECGDAILYAENEVTIAHIGGRIECDLKLFDIVELRRLALYTEDEIRDLFGMVCEYAATPIEKRKKEK